MGRGERSVSKLPEPTHESFTAARRKVLVHRDIVERRAKPFEYVGFIVKREASRALQSADDARLDQVPYIGPAKIQRIGNVIGHSIWM